VPTRPLLDQAVLLERDGVAWARAIVDGYDGADALLEPHDHPPGGVPAEATLTWTSERGLFRSAVRLSVERRLWRARFVGITQRTQRRAFVRVPVGTPMTLTRNNRTYKGVLVDLSEAALRARFDADDTPAMREGDVVRAAFALGEMGFMLRGRVLREQRTESPEWIDVVVLLEIPARTANDLRRGVAFEQLERERMGR
jgi:hypothetical protein